MLQKSKRPEKICGGKSVRNTLHLLRWMKSIQQFLIYIVPRNTIIIVLYGSFNFEGIKWYQSQTPWLQSMIVTLRYVFYLNSKRRAEEDTNVNKINECHWDQLRARMPCKTTNKKERHRISPWSTLGKF